MPDGKRVLVITAIGGGGVGTMTGLSAEGVTQPHAILQLDVEVVDADTGDDPYNADTAREQVVLLLPAPLAQSLTADMLVPNLANLFAMGIRCGDYSMDKPIPEGWTETTFHPTSRAELVTAELDELVKQSSAAEQAAAAHQLKAVDQQGPMVWWGSCTCGESFSHQSSGAVEMAHRSHQRQMIRDAAATPVDQQERDDPPPGA